MSSQTTPPYSFNECRNIGIIAHIDAGKTTTTERILFYTGVNHKIGEVHDGNTTTDWMVQERERGITIVSAATTCFWQNHKISIIDTPGHVDFTMEVERSMRVLDGAILVLCSVGGIQTQSETVWKQAKKNSVPAISFINKLDRTGANFSNAVEGIKNKLDITPIIITFPIGEEENFIGVINVLEKQAYHYPNKKEEKIDFPIEFEEQYQQYYEALVEVLSENDDDIAEAYLEGKSIDIDTLKTTIRKQTLENKIIPVYAGSAFKNKGVEQVLNGVIDFLPKVNFRDFQTRKLNNNIDLQLPVDNNGPLIGLVFKITNDKHIGQVTYFRMYSGTLKRGIRLYNPRTKKMEKIHKIYQMHAEHREESEYAYAGDIVGLAGIKFSGTGDTLCLKEDAYSLESILPPEPVISIIIEAKTNSDKDKLEEALAILTLEDPTLKITIDENTGQTILSGMGELHLEIIVDRIKREFGITPNTGNPQVAYKETLTEQTQANAIFDKIIADTQQLAEISITVEPQEEDNNTINIPNKIENVPSEIYEAIENSLEQLLKTGHTNGYPIIRCNVTVNCINYDNKKSTPIAFSAASSFALNKAFNNTTLQVLEPIMRVDIEVQESYTGEIVSDISSRKGHIINMINQENDSLIKADIPMKNLLKYTTALRSMSKGKASMSMKLSHFQNIQL